jgi:nucleotide sugar dehydrogenase
VLGLIGHGFVGEAVYENLKHMYDFVIYDKKPEKSNCLNIGEVTAAATIIFVALPTPMKPDGECDLSIIFDVFDKIEKTYNNNIIVIKSTILPGTSRFLKEKYPGMRIVFSPEFLTEANHIEDFKDYSMMIFGGPTVDADKCVSLMKTVIPDKQYFVTDWETAETVKYFINNFLATKVSFANEMKQICDLVGTKYDDVVNLALCDERIGKTHFQVPGPDGFQGFGGKCFPKDLNAMIHFCLTNGINPIILNSVWKKNLDIREDHDWLNIDGAVSCIKDK